MRRKFSKIKLFFSNKSNIKIVGIISLIVIFLSLIIIPASFAQVTPVSSVEIPSTTLSYESSEEGSWNIIKSAKWISKGKARITIEFESLVKQINDYTDFILVLDTSGSMNAETTDKEDNTVIKLEQLKSDVNELIDYMIPKGSNISLVTFSDTSTVVSEFTNDETILKENVTNLVAVGETNYYQALVNVDAVLKSYEKQESRDCVVLFLTDGLPTVDTPNEIGQYEYLKSTYPYLVINGLQYEMGEEPLDNIKNITDNEYVASVDTLKKYLYKAAISPRSYEKLEITDYIESDYFNVRDISSITNSSGTISLEENQVIWNLDGINSGSEETLEIDINLNDDLIGVGGIYPTNESISVTYKINNNSITENSTLTPILSDNYLVIYEANAPEGCTVSNMPEAKNVSVLDTVKIETDQVPICEGYQFKEWELVTEDVTQVNANYFVMPEKDVTLRATWSKLNVSKSMDGEISKVQPLYKMIADSSLGLDTDIDFSKVSSDSNGKGVYTVESTENDTYPVHYYRGAVTNNNLIFAGFCWKIVRTTSTGGVKLVYNGEPNEDGQCLNDRSDHIGYGSKTSMSLNSSYYYGTSYTYDSATSTFNLDGELTQAKWDATTGPTLIGKFTCKNDSADGTCSTLYQVASYYSSTSAYVLPLNITTNHTLIGNSTFNSNYTSPADVGYMYGGRYTHTQQKPFYTAILSRKSITSSSEYYYGKSIIYEDGSYVLQNAETKIWSDNYSSLAGYYTCKSTTGVNCFSSVDYIVGTDSGYQYVITLSGGETDPDSKTMVLSKTKINNEDGTYTLEDPITISKKDWFTDHELYMDYYTCNDMNSIECGLTMRQLYSSRNYQAFYDNSIGYVYGSDVEWDGTSYTIIDPIKSNEGWHNEGENIFSKYRYTCLNGTGVCTNIKYIVYWWSSYLHYFNLSNGKKLENIKEEMFVTNKNSISSNIKLQIDSWYTANMTKYTDKLEDTIWCNDRDFFNGPLKNNGALLNNVKDSYFNSYNNISQEFEPSIMCSNINDRFTVSSSTGNGSLIYPAALLTADEINLAGSAFSTNDNYYLYNGQTWWTLSPSEYSQGSFSFYIDKYGKLMNNAFVIGEYGVRPSVSLAPGTKSIDGDGSEENPFIVE